MTDTKVNFPELIETNILRLH